MRKRTIASIFFAVVTTAATAADDSPALARITTFYKNLTEYSVALRIEIFPGSDAQAKQNLQATSYRRGAILLQQFGQMTVFSSPDIALLVDRGSKTIHVNDRRRKPGDIQLQDWDPERVLRRAQEKGIHIAESAISDGVMVRITGTQPRQPAIELLFSDDPPWLKRMELVQPAQSPASNPARVAVSYDWTGAPKLEDEWFRASHYIRSSNGSLMASPEFSGYRVLREETPRN